MIVLSKVSRVPEPGLRSIRVIGTSLPPTSFQFVVVPAKIARTCLRVRSETPVFGLTTTAKTTIATWWSVTVVGSMVLALLTGTSESPMSEVPAATLARPVDEPPPLAVMVPPGHLVA